MNALIVRSRNKTLNLLTNGRFEAAKIAAAVFQVRCESKLAAEEDSSKESSNDGSVASMIRMRQTASMEDSTNVQTGVSSPKTTKTARSSTASLLDIRSASSGTTLRGIPPLSPEEELKLEDMRSAQDEITGELQNVLKQFNAPIRYAFAYGSGVYKQSGYGSSKPMVDLIFAVSHPDHWHALNLTQNRSHYSFMGSLGSHAVTFVQERIGAGVYYNPFIEINGVMVKYGVVSMDTLSSDLLNWDSLYLAGRMHKPTLTLRRDPLMRISKQVNLTHAVRAALLMLPKNFSSTDLFQTITSLSFRGDFRMRVGGENPQKVRNIVDVQMPLFKSRYKSIIEGLPNLEYIGDDVLQQDMGPVARAAMLRKMPNNFYDQLVRLGRKAGNRLPPGLGAEAANSERLVGMEGIRDISAQAIERIVARPAFTQSAKGILTSGVMKSISYMRAKNEKYKQAKNQK
ncbi:Mitochondrial translocator assembly and maintenance protein 41 [Kickxella alabastrina]|uniref:Mitochondrial translocator assembly and maintenance protein 41 n=1 Tax=Kickxella alabastrina TaxID=61397 RepID=A0ACC1IH00_9FUNG|nr:Mitochondrial translocator assembly and maintenance protein 41 [Kickxella alabastrina]